MFKRKSKSDKPAKPKKEKKQKKKAKPAAPMSERIALAKRSTDIYTIMLIISFVAILIACILLWVELSRYGSYPWWTAG